MGANNPNYQVIATDYTSYAVVYSCTNLFFTNISKFFLRNWHIKAQCVKGLLHRCLNGAIGRSLMFVCSSLFLKVAMTNIIKRVEGLYCKRPIQCLASSEILTPHPSTPGVHCTPPPAFGAGGGHTRWVEGVGGQ
jgi:hypothetical protein